MNPILENIKLKSEHAILTESTSTEVEKLEAKILLNEAIQEVNAYFTEASIDGVKKHLKKNWKKYALGAAAVGAAAGGTYAYKNNKDFRNKVDSGIASAKKSGSEAIASAQKAGHDAADKIEKTAAELKYQAKQKMGKNSYMDQAKHWLASK